uniref:Uncharacterized protein n=1 Tax=Panagrolaimus sp. JU765 TaxID=591449 RepID=A0AC34PWN1_9BILA
MKKLKRRLSQAFRPSCHHENENSITNGDIANSFQSLSINGTTTNQINGKNKYNGQSSLKAFGLSDSLNHLSERHTVENIIVEEESTVPNGAAGIYRRRGSRNHLQNNGNLNQPAVIPSRPISYYGHLSNVCEYPVSSFFYFEKKNDLLFFTAM